jgi:hypothetical protein
VLNKISPKSPKPTPPLRPTLYLFQSLDVEGVVDVLLPVGIISGADRRVLAVFLGDVHGAGLFVLRFSHEDRPKVPKQIRRRKNSTDRTWENSIAITRTPDQN